MVDTAKLRLSTVVDRYRGFKGLKQAIKLEFKLARYDQAC